MLVANHPLTSVSELRLPGSQGSRLQAVSVGTKIIQVAVQVTLDSSGKAVFTYNGEENLQIDVSAGEVALIQLELMEGSGVFVTDPINWFSAASGMPVSVPEGMISYCPSQNLAMIVDYNNNPVERRCVFTLSVLVNGDGQHFKVSGEVTDVDPGRSVSFTWGRHDDAD